MLWESDHGSAVEDVGHEVAMDGAGNLYFGATTQGSFEGQPFLGTGAYNLVLSKLSSGGTTLWTKQFAEDLMAGLAVDAAGNAYVAGAFSLHKLSTAGVVQWSLDMAGVDATLRLYGVAVAGDGSGVYAVGYLNGTDEVRLLKYSTAGVLLWSRDLGSDVTTGLDRRMRVASDGDGNAAIVASERDDDRVRWLLAAHYTAAGTKSWERRVQHVSRAFDVAIDGSGNVLAVGSNGITAWSSTGTQLWQQDGSAYGGLSSRGDLAVGGDGSLFLSTSAYVDAVLSPVLLRLQADGAPIWSDIPPFGALGTFSFPGLFTGDLLVDGAGHVVMIETVATAADLNDVKVMKLAVDEPGTRQVVILVTPDAAAPVTATCEETQVIVDHVLGTGAQFEGLEEAGDHTFSFSAPAVPVGNG